MPTISLPLSVNPTLVKLDNSRTMAELRQIHAHTIKSGLVSHTFVMSRLVAALCLLPGASGGLDYAASVFCRIQEPNAFIFFTITRSFADSSNPLESLVYYSRMLISLEKLDGLEFSLPSVLKACGRSLAFEEGRQVHGQILKTHFQNDPFVSNSLLRMYLELQEIGLARRVYDKMPHRDVFSWNSIISGYFKAEEVDLAIELFDEMPERDLVSWNTMIDGLSKCGKCEQARELFEKIKQRDVVSWTTLISGYVLNGRAKEALDVFREMLGSGMEPDAAAIVSVLSAIADLGFVEEGKWVHSYLSRSKLSLNSGVIGSALIDMYSKCGHIENACNVFKSISHRRRIGDWNSMISGLAIHGLGREALEIFHEMEKMEIEPDEITFLGLLAACSHSGLVQEGRSCFKTIPGRYNIVPKIQHYGCLIDLFARAGHLEEALGVIQEMPVEPDVLAWKAILSACMKHGNIEMGKHAALRAIELSPKDSSCYVLFSNIYAKAGKWNDVVKIRSMMRERGIRKVPGCSSILVNGEIHDFLVGKEMDPRYRGMVAEKLQEVLSRLKLEGYEPDLTQVLLDVEEKEKRSLLSWHSEKMALAFGLIKFESGAPIHIVKNLRVCCDCHSFIKLEPVLFCYLDHPSSIQVANKSSSTTCEKNDVLFFATCGSFRLLINTSSSWTNIKDNFILKKNIKTSEVLWHNFPHHHGNETMTSIIISWHLFPHHHQHHRHIITSATSSSHHYHITTFAMS